MTKCITKYCRGSRQKERKYCSRCKHKRSKETNPFGYVFSYLKQNAKRRKRPFSLTRGYFDQWCIDNNYIELKGRYKDSMTIDCQIEELGYADGNLQIMSNSNNVKKKWVKWRKEKQDREVPEDYIPPPMEPEKTSTKVEEIAPF